MKYVPPSSYVCDLFIFYFHLLVFWDNRLWFKNLKQKKLISLVYKAVFYFSWHVNILKTLLKVYYGCLVNDITIFHKMFYKNNCKIKLPYCQITLLPLSKITYLRNWTLLVSDLYLAFLIDFFLFSIIIRFHYFLGLIKF